LPFHERIIEREGEECKRAMQDSGCFSTACWRGYQGTWEIRDGRFYLIKLEGRYRLEGADPLFVDWFTGVLRVPMGERLLYVHMGFGTVFEQELHIKIEDGIVTKTRTIDNRGREHDESTLGPRNYPGLENSFPGDDDL